MLTHHLEILGPLRMMLSLPACALQMDSEAWMTTQLSTTRLTECFKSTAEDYCSEEKFPFKIWLLSDKVPGHPRALMDDEIDVGFMPA